MKILIIDDNTNLTTMFSKMLQISNHQSVVANDGKNGLSLIKQEKFDVIILDLAMAGFSGYDVIDELVKDDSIKNYKIIILTATTITQEKIDHLLNKGVKLVLKKPIKIDDLIEALKNVSGQ